jgi:hypothetical protein
LPRRRPEARRQPQSAGPGLSCATSRCVPMCFL